MASKKHLAIMVVPLLLAILVSACAGAEETASVTIKRYSGPSPVAQSQPTAAPRPSPAPTATVVVTEDRGVEDEMGADRFELGEKIFKVAAGDGIGCSYCHGADARGDIGPNIRGKTPGDVKFALDTVEAMEFLNLSQKKVEAVSEYLKWLATQP